MSLGGWRTKASAEESHRISRLRPRCAQPLPRGPALFLIAICGFFFPQNTAQKKKCTNVASPSPPPSTRDVPADSVTAMANGDEGAQHGQMETLPQQQRPCSICAALLFVLCSSGTALQQRGDLSRDPRGAKGAAGQTCGAERVQPMLFPEQGRGQALAENQPKLVVPRGDRGSLKAVSSNQGETGWDPAGEPRPGGGPGWGKPYSVLEAAGPSDTPAPFSRSLRR